MSSSFHDFNRNLIDDLRAHGGKATEGPFKGRDVLILTTKGARSGGRCFYDVRSRLSTHA